MDLAEGGRVQPAVRTAKAKTLGDHSFGTVILNKSIKGMRVCLVDGKTPAPDDVPPAPPFLRRACPGLLRAVFGVACLLCSVVFSLPLLACALLCLSLCFLRWSVFPHRMCCLFPHPGTADWHVLVPLPQTRGGKSHVRPDPELGKLQLYVEQSVFHQPED